jgi:hypothetical protein
MLKPCRLKPDNCILKAGVTKIHPPSSNGQTFSAIKIKGRAMKLQKRIHDATNTAG